MRNCPMLAKKHAKMNMYGDRYAGPLDTHPLHWEKTSPQQRERPKRHSLEA